MLQNPEMKKKAKNQNMQALYEVETSSVNALGSSEGRSTLSRREQSVQDEK